VYSNRPQVNILEAAPEVVAALPGMTSDRVRTILAQRQAFPENGQALLSMLGAARQYATAEGSKALRVLTQVSFGNGRRTSAEVVILVFDNGNEPYAVLSWQDDLTGSRPTEEMKRGRL
jgi:general secretion pathway protein K